MKQPYSADFTLIRRVGRPNQQRFPRVSDVYITVDRTINRALIKQQIREYVKQNLMGQVTAIFDADAKRGWASHTEVLLHVYYHSL